MIFDLYRGTSPQSVGTSPKFLPILLSTSVGLAPTASTLLKPHLYQLYSISTCSPPYPPPFLQALPESSHFSHVTYHTFGPLGPPNINQVFIRLSAAITSLVVLVQPTMPIWA